MSVIHSLAVEEGETLVCYDWIRHISHHEGCHSNVLLKIHFGRKTGSNFLNFVCDIPYNCCKYT